jgi:alpha-1,6-mannosyltransferase
VTGQLPRSFVACFVSLFSLALFFLVRPALSAQAYYHPRPPGTTYDYWFLVLAMFIPYSLALRSCRRGDRASLPLVLGGAVILYLVLIPAPAVQSQDIYQYLGDGRKVVAGENPYVVGASGIPDSWKGYVLWDEARSVYGPAWTLTTAAIVWVTGGSLVGGFLLVKALAAVLAVATSFLLVSASRGGAEPKGGASFVVLAFAYNPLVVFSVGLGAHADVAVAAGITGAAAASRRDRDSLATLLLVAATLVKAYAGLVLLIWLIALARRRGLATGLKQATGAAVLVALAFVPFWEGIKTFSGWGPVGRLASSSLTGTIQRLAAGEANEATAGAGSVAAVAVRVVGGAVLVLVIVVVLRSARTGREPWRAAAIVMAVYVLVVPWYVYWHLIGLVVLAVIAADDVVSVGVYTFSATSLVVAGGSTVFPGGVVEAGLAFQTALRYGPPVGLAWARARWTRVAVSDGSPLGSGAPPPPP